MAMFDTAELLAKLKARGQIPVSAGTWTDDRLYEAMSDEAETWLMPLLIKAKGEYLVKTQDLPFVVGQQTYRFSSRVAAVRQVSRLLADGTEVPLEELNPAQQTEMQVISTRQGVPMFYTFVEGVLSLWPTPGQTGDSLRVRYHHRLNRLVPPSSCVRISGWTLATGSITLSGAVPAAMTALQPEVGYPYTIDVIRATPLFDVIGIALDADNWTTGDVTIDVTPAELAALVADGLLVGDYIAVQRRTPVPNMPPELHICAALRAAAVAVKSKGDAALSKSLLEEAGAKEASLLTGILEPRSKGNSHRLVNRRFR